MKAFPKPFGGCNIENRGMDLRDYFAAKAMQSILMSGKYGPPAIRARGQA